MAAVTLANQQRPQLLWCWVQVFIYGWCLPLYNRQVISLVVGGVLLFRCCMVDAAVSAVLFF
ncbi:hypothetical protein, partial [Neomicrococcus lactis]